MINNLTVLKFENNYLFKSEINCLKYFFNIFSTEREDVLKLNYYVLKEWIINKKNNINPIKSGKCFWIDI